jgi:hypothetical protein
MDSKRSTLKAVVEVIRKNGRVDIYEIEGQLDDTFQDMKHEEEKDDGSDPLQRSEKCSS